MLSQTMVVGVNVEGEQVSGVTALFLDQQTHFLHFQSIYTSQIAQKTKIVVAQRTLTDSHLTLPQTMKIKMTHVMLPPEASEEG